MSTKVILFVAWSLLTLCVISVGTSMITLSDTLANIAGVFVITLWGVVSVKTKCLIGTFKFINKLKTKK